MHLQRMQPVTGESQQHLLAEAKFTECDLCYASFHHTNLEKADFSTARNYALNPAANRLKKARFSRYGLEGLLTGLGIEVVD